VLLLGICFDLVSQMGMCRLAASALNLRPQKLHWTLLLACSVAAFYSADRVCPRPYFSLARKAALSAFHLGCLPSFAGGGVFLLFWAGSGGGCLKSSTYGARWAAALKALRLDWKTFSQTFSCLAMTYELNCRPQPLEHSTSSMSASSS
jgi:hypothetical protein